MLIEVNKKAFMLPEICFAKALSEIAQSTDSGGLKINFHSLNLILFLSSFKHFSREREWKSENVFVELWKLLFRFVMKETLVGKLHSR